MSYIPPITADIIYEQGELEKKIIDEQDHYIYTQLMSVSNIVVDEERLKKALAFDRGQFYEGYHQGYETRDNEIVRCKDCKHSKYREDYDDYECEASGCGLVNNADFYCADGERKESK